jgi:predicted dehydrogenase
MKTLIVGLSFGQLYKSIYESIGAEIITVDRDETKHPDFVELTTALEAHPQFDTAHICTPNKTHFNLAKSLSGHCNIVFVEKPGVKNVAQWQALINDKKTRYVMTKNNQYRDNIGEMTNLSHNVSSIDINWKNNNRIPSPGSWFTNKDLAFGGVSRDLLPHMLSLLISMAPQDYDKYTIVDKHVEQRYRLEDCTDTDYGIVNENGVYDVEDNVYLKLVGPKNVIKVNTSWRTDEEDDIAVHMYKGKLLFKSFPLGLCPENAYKTMIENHTKNLNNEEFWKEQNKQDLFIHSVLENGI